MIDEIREDLSSGLEPGIYGRDEMGSEQYHRSPGLQNSDLVAYRDGNLAYMWQLRRQRQSYTWPGEKPDWSSLAARDIGTLAEAMVADDTATAQSYLRFDSGDAKKPRATKEWKGAVAAGRVMLDKDYDVAHRAAGAVMSHPIGPRLRAMVPGQVAVAEYRGVLLRAQLDFYEPNEHREYNLKVLRDSAEVTKWHSAVYANQWYFYAFVYLLVAGKALAPTRFVISDKRISGPEGVAFWEPQECPEVDEAPWGLDRLIDDLRAGQAGYSMPKWLEEGGEDVQRDESWIPD